MKPNSQWLPVWAWSILYLVMVGCTSVRVDSVGGFALQAGDTYTWVEGNGPSDAGKDLGEDVPWADLHAALDAALQERGLIRVEGQQADNAADIQVEMLLGFEVLTRQHDPYFSFYVADRYEQASLVLSLVDRQGGRWTARDEQKLRLVERSIDSVAGSTWVDANQERAWDVDQFVSGIVKALRSVPFSR